jgi:hypothetical protein
MVEGELRVEVQEGLCLSRITRTHVLVYTQLTSRPRMKSYYISPN